MPLDGVDGLSMLDSHSATVQLQVQLQVVWVGN